MVARGQTYSSAPALFICRGAMNANARRLLLLMNTGASLALPATNQLSWWSASKDVYSDTGLTTPVADGGTVAGWKDQSANALHVTQSVAGDRPIYRLQVAALNNKPAIEFVSSDFLIRTGMAAGVVANLNVYTIYVVYASSVGTQAYLYAEGNSGNNTPFVGARINPTQVSNVHNSDAGVLANTVGNPATANNGVKHILTFRRIASNSWQGRLDGTSIGTDTAAPGATTINQIAIGALARIATASFITGYIAQVAIYSADNFATIEPLLAAYYGIALP